MTDRLLISILLLTSFFGTSQSSIDSAKITNLILRSSNLSPLTVDQRIVKTIDAIDLNINEVVKTKTTYRPKKYTIIEHSVITVKQLTDKKEAVKAILADSADFNFKKVFVSNNNDTTKFLSNFLVRQYFDSPIYSINILSIDPLMFNQTNKNIFFFNDKINQEIKSLFKKYKAEQRRLLDDYLLANFDHYSSKDNKIETQSIKICTITFDKTYVYATIDIYGTHYELTFDSTKNWTMQSVVSTWTN